MANDTGNDNRERRNNSAKASDVRPARKKGQPHWRLFTMLATLAVIVWLLPIIVVKTPLFGWILKKSTADLNGSVTIKSVSLGWLSPIEVQGIEMKDANGKTVLSVDSVTGDRRLAAIACNYSNLGKFTLLGTKLSVAMRDNGTNIEDVLAQYLAPQKETTEKPVAKSSLAIGVVVEAIDASASITDVQTGLVWQLQKLSLKFGMDAKADGPMIFDVATDLHDSHGTGKLSAGIKMTSTASEAKVSIAQFPLPMLRALIARIVPGTTLTGRLSSEIGVRWGNKSGKNEIAASLSTENFSLSSPTINKDELRLARLQAICQASWQGDRLDIEKSAIECDIGNALLTGSVPLGSKDGFSPKAIMHQRQEFSGTVDLARLAQMLPATLHIRQQTRIESGQVQWVWNSRPEQQKTTWHGQIEAANLTATDATGRRSTWNKPIVAVIDAHDVAGGEPIVDRLLCQSDFLTVDGAGTTDNLTAKLTFSLNKLAEQLGQFVNISTLQLAGEGAGNLTWKRTPQQQFDAGAEIQLRGFQLQMANSEPQAKNPPLWREDSLLVYASAKGQTNFDANTRIDAARLNIRAATDQIDVNLMEPVKDLHNGGVWPISVQMQGQLQNWPARLAAWMPTGNCQLAGGYIMKAEAAASKDGADLRQMQFAAAPLLVSTSMLNIKEERVDVTLAGSWNQEQRRLLLPLAKLVCSTAAVEAKNVIVSLPATGTMELAGAISYQGDVGRIRQWFIDPAIKTPWRMAGQLQGTANLQQTAGVVRGTTMAQIANLAMIDSTGQQIKEPMVQLVAQGDYDTKSQILQLSRCELTSSAITAAAAGRINQVGGRENAQLEAKFNYDLERLTALLRPLLGKDVQIAGQGTSSASYQGPFALADASAAATVRWTGAQLYGFPLGPAEVKVTMTKGVAQIEPLDLPVGGGKMHLAPSLRLTSDPMELSLPRGSLAERIQIDPAMCGSMLQYIAPVLAGVTTAKGAFSIDLDDCRIPLGDINKANMTGRFTIHSVEIGPGPMIKELAVFMSRQAPAQLKRESVVPFQVANGRVRHDNLELIFPDITIRSSGWVTMSNQAMDIMVVMPVPPKWQVGNTVLANAVRTQTISVPLRGTLSKPALDQKAVENFTRQFMQKAAGNVIEGELNRLFGPKK